MPMIVIQKSSPSSRCPNASHHPASITHITFIIIERQPPPPTGVTPFCPKGSSARIAILNTCTPKGMPMMVRHSTSPALKYPRAISSPPNTIQMIFPSSFSISVMIKIIRSMNETIKIHKKLQSVYFFCWEQKTRRKATRFWWCYIKIISPI